jgi:hypothetical protein
MLTKLEEGLWTAARPLKFLGLEVGTRMSCVRLSSGGLFIHSPVSLDEATKRALDALGPVRFVVAPNRYHHLYVGDYFKAYPKARIFAAPALPEKRTDLRFHGVLASEPPQGWAGEIDQIAVAGMPLLNEVVFFHKRSRTLILTDLAMNICRESPFWLKLSASFTGNYGKLAVPPELRWVMFRDKPAARESINRILQWDFDRVSVTHGEIYESGGKAALKAAYAWLL